MKAIIVKEANREKIDKAIKAAQERATARTITTDDIFLAIEQITKKLPITKKALDGTIANVDIHAQKFPNSYQYRAVSTHFNMIYQSGSWRLISVSREYTRGAGHMYHLVLSDTAKIATIKAAELLKL